LGTTKQGGRPAGHETGGHRKTVAPAFVPAISLSHA